MPQKTEIMFRSNDAASNGSEGDRFDSVLYELTDFHVCEPGLHPCLYHDLFEAIVLFGLALHIKHLVKVDKQFTYLELK